MSRMRIWTGRDGPDTDLPEGAVCVEWACRVGHHSSYGLLGGVAGRSTTDSAWETSMPWPASLAGTGDEVWFGMTAHYLSAIEPLDFNPVLAAHGRAGSSWVVFHALSTFVARMLREGVPPDDAACWAIWEECLVDARRAGQAFFRDALLGLVD